MCRGWGPHPKEKKTYDFSCKTGYFLFIWLLYSSWKIFQQLYPLGRHHFTIHHFIDFSTCFVLSKALFKKSVQIQTAPTTKDASRRVSCPVACFHTDNLMVMLHCQMQSVPLLHPLYTALAFRFHPPTTKERTTPVTWLLFVSDCKSMSLLFNFCLFFYDFGKPSILLVSP